MAKKAKLTKAFYRLLKKSVQPFSEDAQTPKAQSSSGYTGKKTRPRSSKGIFS